MLLQEIDSKFAWLYTKKNGDCDFISRDKELCNIGVRAIYQESLVTNNFVFSFSMIIVRKASYVSKIVI